MQRPEAQRKLVTDHDAFFYFARRYGIEVVGAVIPARTSQAQPSAGDVARLVDTDPPRACESGLPRACAQRPKLAETIARETGASADFTLYADTLGSAGSSGETPS